MTEVRLLLACGSLVVACTTGTNGDDTGSSSESDTRSETTDDGTSDTTTSDTEGSGESGEESTDETGCPDGELGDDENCGACGVACTVYDLYAFGEYGGCDGDTCMPTWSPCFGSDAGYADCAAACDAIGEQCVPQGCGPAPSVTATAYTNQQACEEFESPQDAWYGMGSCDEAPLLGDGAARCCCTDTP